MSVQRKRISVACEFCRKRCDGKLPKCQNCILSDAVCVYPKLLTQRYGGGMEEMIERLESQNEQLSKCIDRLQDTLESQPKRPYMSNSPTQQDEDSGDSEPLVIPSSHSTTANRMLTIKNIQDLVGRFDPDYFLKLEANNPFALSDGSADDTSDYFSLQNFSKTPSYIENFFNSVHPHFPILDKTTFMSAYNNGLDEKMSIIGHLVIALGAFILDPVLSLRMFHRTFSKVSTEMKWCFASTIEDVQISLLCAVYFAYSLRPLESWKMVYEAAATVQFLLKSYLQDVFGAVLPLSAELNLPRTGLDIIAENQPLPGEFTSDDREMVYFLAEISIRTLLNRIHHAFYSNHGLSQQVMISLNVELRRQLESWLESIPFSERPFIDDSEESTHQNANIRQKILQIRYFAARQILYRPFILLTLSSNQQPEYSILENCRQCIDTAKQYLNCITGVINQPGPYTWTFSQSSFGTILTLIAAWQHPYLKPYLSDMKELLSLVISNLSKWEHSNPTIKAHVWILQTIEQKCFY